MRKGFCTVHDLRSGPILAVLIYFLLRIPTIPLPYFNPNCTVSKLDFMYKLDLPTLVEVS